MGHSNTHTHQKLKTKITPSINFQMMLQTYQLYLKRKILSGIFHCWTSIEAFVNLLWLQEPHVQ